MTVEEEQTRRRSLLPFAHSLQALVHGRLWLQVLVGMALGICTGLLIGPTTGLLSKEVGSVVGNWLAFPGPAFSRPYSDDRYPACLFLNHSGALFLGEFRATAAAWRARDPFLRIDDRRRRGHRHYVGARHSAR